MRYGKYCGPNWSAGKRQKSVCSNLPSTDKLDETCKTHDCDVHNARAAASRSALQQADRKFVKTAQQHGVLGRTMATLVNMAGPGTTHLRGSVAEKPVVISSMAKQTKNKTQQQPKKKVNQTNKGPSSTLGQVIRAPVNIGTSMTGHKPISKATTNGVMLTGRDYGCPVSASNSTYFQLGAAIPLNPSYFNGGVLGNVARAYNKFNFRKLVVHFVTRTPTSSNSEILLTQIDDIQTVNPDGAASSFLPRTMSRHGSVLGPLWANHSITVDVNKRQWCTVDCMQDADINDNTYGEVQAYVSGLITKSDVVGYLVVDYTIEFADAVFQPRSTLLPYACGLGSFLGMYYAAAPVAANAVAFAQDVPITAAGTGSIFKFTINNATSTYCTGLTAANSWNSSLFYFSNTTTETSSTNAVSITNGMVIYLVKRSTTAAAYLTLQSAIDGSASGQLFYQTSSTAADNNGILFGLIYQVQYGPADMSTPT